MAAPIGYWCTLSRGESTVNAVSSGDYADLGRAPTFSDNPVEVTQVGILADLAVARDDTDDKERLGQLAAFNVKMVEIVRRSTCTVGFWRNTYQQNRLRGEIVEFLDENDIVPFTDQEAVADKVVELAKALHARLCL